MSKMFFSRSFTKELHKAEKFIHHDSALYEDMLHHVLEQAGISKDSIPSYPSAERVYRCPHKRFHLPVAACVCAAFIIVGGVFFAAHAPGSLFITDDEVPLSDASVLSVTANCYQVVWENGVVSVNILLQQDSLSQIGGSEDIPALESFWIEDGFLNLQISDQISWIALEQATATDADGNLVAFRILNREQKVLVFELPLTELTLII